MNGAESLVHSLVNAGIDTCFANPGTSEMHFVAALDMIAGIHCVLGLQENVVTGMADGYYRIAGRPACTLLHCGPGLANGLANLHNARRGQSGIVNIVGDQATYHRPFDPPLTTDTEALARTVSAWVRTSTTAAEVGRDAVAAVQAARMHPGQVATLILPANTSWDAGGQVATALPIPPPAPIDPYSVQQAARLLRSAGKQTLILVSGQRFDAASQELAWQIASATGATLMADTVACLARGHGRLALARVPYVMEQALAALRPFRQIILVNATPPIGFFAYPGKPSQKYASDTHMHILAREDQDGHAALQALVAELNLPAVPIPAPDQRPELVRGPITPEGLGRTLAALIPENAIIADEGLTYGRGCYPQTYAAPPHDWLQLSGGAIGDGLPMATGAALAARGERRVINLQADGSAMYTLQALWTQAREQLPCTTLILNNRSYNILIGEYQNVGATPGATAMRMLDLGTPPLNWVQLANGMGVEAAQATTLDACADLLAYGLRQPGPFLIEVMVNN